MLPKPADFAQILRGFMMGGADIIPGVSGGTVALILGIYDRLVTAISHFDGRLLKLLSQRQWREAAQHVDLRFLVTLGLGILTGIACLANAMLYLLTEQRSYTLAAFMGLILASSLIVARSVQPKTIGDIWKCCSLGILAAVFAFWLVGLDKFDDAQSLPYFFLCGMVAICAMILPGISGAYILWLLGAYATVADLVHRLTTFDVEVRDLLILIVFAVGCAVGIISFSKLLGWLLKNACMSTMAVLCGFMLGSLRLMWPFQRDLTPKVEKLKLKQFEPILPEAWDYEVTACLVIAVVAVAAVFMLERFSVCEEPKSQPEQ